MSILSILIFSTITALICHAANWESMPGSASHISAKGQHLMAVTRYRTVLDWNEAKQKWDQLYGSARYIASAGLNGAWAISDAVVTDPTRGSNNVWRWTPYTPRWDNQISMGLCTYVNAISDTSAVCVHGGAYGNPPGPYSGCLFFHNGQNWVIPTWGDDCHNLQAAIGDGGEIWKIDQNSNLYRRANGAWQLQTRFPNTAFYVDVQSPNRVVVVDKNETVHFFDGTDWFPLDGVKCLQATVNYNYVYCLDGKNIWKRNLTTASNQTVQQNW